MTTWGFCVSAMPVLALQTAPAPEDLRLSALACRQSDSLAHFATGLLLLWEQADQPDLAWTHFAESLRLEPDAKPVLQQLATPMIVAEQHGRLADYLIPVANAHPDATMVLVVCSQALIHAKRGDEAVQLLRQALANTHWRDAVLVRQLVACHERLEQETKVAEVLRRAAKQLAGDFVFEHTLAVRASRQLGSAQSKQLSERQQQRLRRKVMQHCRRAAADRRNAPDAADLASLAALLMELQNWQLAAELLEYAESRFEYIPVELSLQYVQCLQELGQHDQAVQLLAKLQAEIVTRPLLYVELGRRYLASEQYSDAAAAYEIAVLVHPKSSRLRFTLAYIYEVLDEPARILELLAGGQARPEILLLRSRAYYSLGRLPEAAKALGEAEELARQQEDSSFFSVRLYLYYATLCEEMDYIDRAIEMGRKAVELEPDSHVAANFLGYVMADHNRELATAEALIDQALGADPDNIAYLDSRAWVYYRQGRSVEAMQVMHQVLRHISEAETDPVILDHAADIYAANHLPLLAQRYWWEALARGASNADAIHAKQEAAAGETGADNTGIVPSP